MFLLILIILVSCSPETKYGVLSFFFDGVPDPHKTEKTKDSANVSKPEKELVAKNAIKTLVMHPPYEEKACDGCHQMNNSYKLKSKQPDLCYTCHESFESKFKVVHGPVASGYCTECHSPHSSDFKKLLVSDNQKLCFKCHQQSDVLSNDVHSGIGDTKCWDCHNPHGGTERTLQR